MPDPGPRMLTRVLVWTFAALVAAGWVWWGYEQYFRTQPERLGLTSAMQRAKPPTNVVVDPLASGRPALLDPTPRPAPTPDWVRAHPAFQYSRSSAERDGVNPCNIPLPDAGTFDGWTSLSHGRVTAPREGALDATGAFDLVLNFHGDDLARRELLESGAPFVLYSLTLDASQSYAGTFAGSKLYSNLIQQIEHTLSSAHGVKAHVRHVALTAWSAGYMAVLSILAQPETPAADAVILIDGLHGQRGALEYPFATLVDYARRAEKGERFLYITHSSIDPPDFASTTESAHYLLSALGEKPKAVRRADRVGLELVEYFTRGELHVRGYAGNDKADHCAQVTLLRDGYQAVGRRWGR